MPDVTLRVLYRVDRNKERLLVQIFGRASFPMERADWSVRYQIFASIMIISFFRSTWWKIQSWSCSRRYSLASNLKQHMLTSTLAYIKITISSFKSFSQLFGLALQKVNIYFLICYPAIKSIDFIFVCEMALLRMFQISIHLINFWLQWLNEIFGILVLLFHLCQPSFVLFNQILKFNELSRRHRWFLLLFWLLSDSSQLLFGPAVLRATPLLHFFANLFKLVCQLLSYVALLFLDLLPLKSHRFNHYINSIDQVLRHYAFIP